MSDSESDDAEEYSDADQADQQFSSDKRAHHNALERKRRVHIKDSFHMLRDSIPGAFVERASRATILNKATEYIELMKSKNTTHQQDIEVLKEENQLLEQQIRALENAVSVEQAGPGPSEELAQGVSSAGSRSASDIESGDVLANTRTSGSSRRKKKLKPLPVDDV